MATGSSVRTKRLERRIESKQKYNYNQTLTSGKKASDRTLNSTAQKKQGLTAEVIHDHLFDEILASSSHENSAMINSTSPLVFQTPPQGADVKQGFEQDRELKPFTLA